MNAVNAQKDQTTDLKVGSEASFTINGKTFSLPRGRHPVAHLKVLGGVNPTHELEQVKAGELLPLPDDGAVIIQGNEVFISHPRDSASS